MYAIKRGGKYLCGFMFRDGYDYRDINEISYFAWLVTTSNQDEKQIIDLASEYDGKIVSIRS
jgi:hypothetical protein